MDKSALFVERIPQESIDIDGVGTVTVRGLSRAELLLAGKLSDQGPGPMERRMLSYALVDPELNEDDVELWQQRAPAGEIQPVVAAVNRLSGIGKDAQKEAYKSVPE